MNQDEARLAVGITAHQKFKVDAGGRRGREKKGRGDSEESNGIPDQ